jgi:hypothetical protein
VGEMERPEIWTRNSFDVQAIRVTEANIVDVALWCGGTVGVSIKDYPKKFIRFGVVQYDKHKEAKAFVGDWIFLIDDEFKHYRDKSFKLAYHKKDGDTRRRVREFLQEQEDLDYYSFPNLDWFTDQIMNRVDSL